MRKILIFLTLFVLLLNITALTYSPEEARHVTHVVAYTSVLQSHAFDVPTPAKASRHSAPQEATRSHPSAGRPKANPVAPVRPHPRRPLLAWASQPRTVALRYCESSGNYASVSSSGTYRGGYQMDTSFWVTYGGNPAITADQASVAEQDRVAYAGYLARGWEPWQCARTLHFI